MRRGRQSRARHWSDQFTEIRPGCPIAWRGDAVSGKLDASNENDYYLQMTSTRKTAASDAVSQAEGGIAADTGSQRCAVAGRISSANLLGTQRELIILHRGREYRLRVTQNDKLILTA